MIVADRLQIPLEQDPLRRSPTPPWCRRGGGTGGSRSLQLGGSAVFERGRAAWSAQAARSRRRCSRPPPTTSSSMDGGVGVAGVPASALTWAQLAAAATKPHPLAVSDFESGRRDVPVRRARRGRRGRHRDRPGRADPPRRGRRLRAHPEPAARRRPAARRASRRASRRRCGSSTSTTPTATRSRRRSPTTRCRARPSCRRSRPSNTETPSPRNAARRQGHRRVGHGRVDARGAERGRRRAAAISACATSTSRAPPSGCGPRCAMPRPAVVTVAVARSAEHLRQPDCAQVARRRRRCRHLMIVPTLLRARSSDEYARCPVVGRRPSRRSPATTRSLLPHAPSTARPGVPCRGAGVTWAIDAAHGGGFFAVPERRGARARRGRGTRSGGVGPVIDVQTHLVDPARWIGAGRRRARRLPAHGRSRSVAGRDRPARHRRRGVGRARVRRVGDRGRAAHVDARAAPTSTCSRTRRSRRRATSSTATRAPGACSRTRSCIPNLGPAELDAMVDWQRDAAAVGLEVLHALGSADEGVADRRLVPRRRRGRLPVPRTGARARPARRRHAQGARRSDPRRIGRGRVAARHRSRRRGRFPTSRSSCTTRATNAIPTAQEGPYDGRRAEPDTGVDRLVQQPSRTPASDRAATCTPSSAARGS